MNFFILMHGCLYMAPSFCKMLKNSCCLLFFYSELSIVVHVKCQEQTEFEFFIWILEMSGKEEEYTNFAITLQELGQTLVRSFQSWQTPTLCCIVGTHCGSSASAECSRDGTHGHMCPKLCSDQGARCHLKKTRWKSGEQLDSLQNQKASGNQIRMFPYQIYGLKQK